MVIQYQSKLKQLQLLVEEEESINKILYLNPKVFDDIDIDVNKVADILLPFSIGIEIECDKLPTFNIEDFNNIPYILDVDIDSSEQRFRIPSGLKGLKCLYDISMMLYKNSLINVESGIHYHIDCTSFFDKITKDVLEENSKGILLELDDWEYKGTYNRREINFHMRHCWIRRQESFKTLECRIGEMTFDYKLLFLRIVHLSQIIKDLKYSCEYFYYLKNDLTKLYDKNIYKVLRARKEQI